MQVQLTLNKKELAYSKTEDLEEIKATEHEELNCFEELKNKKCPKRKYDLNLNYFKEINKQNAYWAGFIAADGYIESAGKRVGIKLQVRDKHHLELFKQHCKYTGPVAEYTANTNKAKNSVQCRILTTATAWVYDLRENFNITPNKSLILEPPKGLTLEQELCFLLGYLDGNGSILTTSYYRIEVCGSKAVMEWARDLVNSLTSEYKRNNSTNVKPVLATPNLYKYQVGGKQALAMANIFRSLYTPYLKRKWSKLFQLNLPEVKLESLS